MYVIRGPKVIQAHVRVELGYSGVLVVVLFAAFVIGCCSESTIRADKMPNRLLAAVQAGRSGMTIMMSGVPVESMSPKEMEMAAAYVKSNPDVSSYHLLMALRKQAPQVYQDIPDTTKARVLCDAFAKVDYFNDFKLLGGPEIYYNSANALVSLGKVAIPLLQKLLQDRRETLALGSIDATGSLIQRYRRCDWAYMYVVFILGRKPVLPHDLAERDKLIAELDEALKSGKPYAPGEPRGDGQSPSWRRVTWE